ncbi:MAG: adenosylcobinamide-GDP ribazoletransferase, partial [Fibrobacter sp.]|nr:adenosylcobinamide-GDP ribazoletransferase [Fibrobacter sp.]
MIRGLITAIRTLTIIPVCGREVSQKCYSLLWFVIVGSGIGFVQYFVGSPLLGLSGKSLGMTAFFMVAINYVLTGGLHLDGLADTADGFGTVHSREKTLEILKDSHIGAFGAIAIVFGILWRLIIYYQLLCVKQTLWILYGISMARVLQALMLLNVPYARGKDGKAYGYKGPFFVSIVLILQLILLVMYITFSNSIVVAIIPFCTAFFVLFLLLSLFIRRLGGITGDCLGAATE